MPEDGSRGATGPIDAELLERMYRRLVASDRFAAVEYRPPVAPNAVVATYGRGYFPAGVEGASLRIRWFQTDDFTVHYLEEYRDGRSWECRWDRHPNEHNSRDHFHPPPDAATPGEDASWPSDWRDVLARVLSELNRRIRAFWE